MQKETENWLKFSEENLAAAKILFDSELFNPCLQNIQQCIEKALKAIFIEKEILFKKTHNIMELKTALDRIGIPIILTEDECDFLDSIYLPSKYPIGSALPHYEPGIEICNKSLKLAENVFDEVKKIIQIRV